MNFQRYFVHELRRQPQTAHDGDDGGGGGSGSGDDLVGVEEDAADPDSAPASLTRNQHPLAVSAAVDKQLQNR